MENTTPQRCSPAAARKKRTLLPSVVRSLLHRWPQRDAAATARRRTPNTLLTASRGEGRARCSPAALSANALRHKRPNWIIRMKICASNEEAAARRVSSQKSIRSVLVAKKGIVDNINSHSDNYGRYPEIIGHPTHWNPWNPRPWEHLVYVPPRYRHPLKIAQQHQLHKTEKNAGMIWWERREQTIETGYITQQTDAEEGNPIDNECTVTSLKPVKILQGLTVRRDATKSKSMPVRTTMLQKYPNGGIIPNYDEKGLKRLMAEDEVFGSSSELLSEGWRLRNAVPIRMDITSKWAALTDLCIENCPALEELNDDIRKLVAIERLIIRACPSFVRISPRIGDLQNLQELRLYQLKSLSTLPHEIGDLQALQILHIKYMPKLNTLPSSIGRLRYNLKQLRLDYVPNFASFPQEICDLEQLTCLSITGSRNLVLLPEDVGSRLDKLESLHLGTCWSLDSLPESLGIAKSLRKLEILRCVSLSRLPRSLDSNNSLKFLSINGCCGMQGWENFYLPNDTFLRKLPINIGRLESIVSLNLGHTKIQQLPAFIKSLPKLNQLVLSGLGATVICEFLKSGNMPSFCCLQKLSLDRCALGEEQVCKVILPNLPESLIRLNLSNNVIRSLRGNSGEPAGAFETTKLPPRLQCLDLTGNPIESLLQEQEERSRLYSPMFPIGQQPLSFLEDLFQRNPSLCHVGKDRRGEAYYSRNTSYWLWYNRGGRYLLDSSANPLDRSVWPLVLAHSTNSQSVLYALLHGPALL